MNRIGGNRTSHEAHLLEALDQLAAGRRRERLRGRGVLSDRALAERRAVHRRALSELHAAGYQIRRLQSLSTRHLEVIVSAWRARGLGAGSVRTYVAYLKMLCHWLDKPQLSAHLARLIKPERRLARQSSAVGHVHGHAVSLIDILAAAQEVDARFACILALIAILECTPKAAWLVRPWQLNLTAKTRAVVEWARTFAQAPHGSMIPPSDSLTRWQRTFYRYCRAIGLTRQTRGITARHLPLLDTLTPQRWLQTQLIAGENRATE